MSADAMRFAAAPRSLNRETFLATFGGVYEGSAWIARQAHERGLDATHDTVGGLAAALAGIVDGADDARRLALIRAHPDLAGRAALRGDLTRESAGEQASAGIDQCTPEEFAEFQRLNAAYKEKFDFPFVMAVKHSNRHAILRAFAERAGNDRGVEIERAIQEIHRIARLRLEQIAAQAGGATPGSATGDPQQVNPFHEWIALEQPRLGTRVVYATDDFFAAKERLIEPHEPVFVPDKYDANGKWMDGWESRRRRTPGHDHCIVRLGVPGIVRGVNIDTRHFTGNHPAAASLDVCRSDEAIPPAQGDWREVLPQTPLVGDSQHWLVVDSGAPVTHLKLHIYPDGGVARLRVFGEVCPNWCDRNAAEPLDLVALENGGRALCCSDEHFGSMHNLNVAGRGVNMGDGWETARRRGPGHDWVLLALGHMGIVEKAIVDTAHFKGNYPDRVSLEAACLRGAVTPRDLLAAGIPWQTLLPEAKLAMDRAHEFRLQAGGPVTHVRMNIFPDGGISRLRLFGRISRDGATP